MLAGKELQSLLKGPCSSQPVILGVRSVRFGLFVCVKHRICQRCAQVKEGTEPMPV